MNQGGNGTVSPPERKPSALRVDRLFLAWAAGVSAALVFIPLTVANQRFVRDDWNHYVNMRLLHDKHSVLEAIGLLTTNEWFGAHELRIFFGSFLSHYVISSAGPAAPFIAYFLLATLHASSGILIGLVVWRLLRIHLLAISVMIATVYFPPASQSALWINNLFFVQPWTLYLAALVVITSRKLGTVMKATLASVLAIACVFSGEAIIPLALVTLAGWPIYVALQRRSLSVVLVSAIPALVTSLALTLYLTRIVSAPPSSEVDLARLGGFTTYLDGAKNQAIGLMTPSSEYYGSSSVSVTFPSVAVAALLIMLVLTALLSPPAFARVRDLKTSLIVLGLMVVGLVASVIPWMIGVVTGARPGPDLRYLYIPGIIIVTIALTTLTLITVRTSRSAQIVNRLLMISIVVFSCFLTVFNITVVWQTQRLADDRIWNALWPYLTSDTRVVVTHNPNHPYLMAPYHSGAISDFQADWGVAGRIAWDNPGWSRVSLYQDAQLQGDRLALRHYYDNATTCLSAGEVAGGEIIFVAFDYGPVLDDLRTSPLLVTSDYEVYRTFLRSMAPPQGASRPLFIWPECS